MHQQPADGMPDVPAFNERKLTDRLGRIALEAEFGRVVQDQDRTRGRGEPGRGGRDVPAQYDTLIDPRVVKEPVGGFSRSPILAGHPDRAADPLSQVAKQDSQSGLQPLVRERTAVQLPLHPDVHVGDPGSMARPLTSDLGVMSIPRKPAVGCADLWVIESFTGRIPLFEGSRAEERRRLLNGETRSGEKQSA